MSCVPRRWMLMAWLLCSLPAAFAQQPPPPRQAPQATEIALPATEAPEPLPWVPAPAGPGEFLFSRPGPQQGLPVGDCRVLATSIGLLRARADGSVSLLPALYGKSAWLVGLFDGKLWVQNTKGGLFALNLKTLAVTEEYPEVAGQCLAVTPAGFWCPDNFELTQGFGTRGVNSAPAAYGLILYDRQGKEARRLKADGTAFPKSEIHWAAPDGDAIWIIARTSLGVICGCGARHYAAGHLYRVDCAAGTVQMMKTALNPAVPFILKDRLVWIVPSEEYDRGNAEVMQLDKRTLAVTRLGAIPGKYAGRVVVDERYLWCFPDDYYRRGAEEIAAELVVYSSRTCRRVRLAEAGPAPDPEERLPPMLRRPDPQDARLLAADYHCAWLQHAAASRVYELPDDGPLRALDLAGIAKQRDERRFLWSRWSLPDGCLFYPDENFGRLLLVKAGKPTATRLDFPDSINRAAAGDRRLWFFGHGEDGYTAGPDLRFRPVTLPRSSGGDESAGLAVGDALYFFGEQGPQKLDGVTGQASAIASWTAQLSEDERAKLEMPYLAYRAPDGRLVYLFRERNDDKERHSVAVSYDPAQDRWQRNRVDNRYFTEMVVTPAGSYLLTYDDEGAIYRGEGDGLTPAGRLPFTAFAFRAFATGRYLYLDTEVGVYRAPWAELLRDRRN